MNEQVCLRGGSISYVSESLECDLEQREQLRGQ